MRLFIGLKPDEDLLRDLLAVQERFTAGDFPFLRRVPVENLHVTLHFLGETDPARLADLDGLLIRAAALARPIAVQALELGAFPGLKRAKGVELTLSCTDRALEEFHGLLGQFLQSAGFPTEKRRYKPHITLARVKGRSPRSFTPEDLAVPALSGRSYPLRQMLLYRSELTSGGARYYGEGNYQLGTDSEAE